MSCADAATMKEEAMKLYQLVAKGVEANPLVGDARQRIIYSRVVFSSAEDAENGKQSFAENATCRFSEHDYNCLLPDGLEIHVVELELAQDFL